MTDKVQKIKDWIGKEQDGLMDANGNFGYPEHEGAYHILCSLDAYIDSLQEEPVSKDFEKALAREWQGYNDRGAATVGALEDNTQELAFAKGFYRGANWQKEQFEKNRLKHCNSITNEQAELEQGFIDQHLDEHQRMPTFLDAIEYGMKKMKEQMMAKAVDGDITFDYYGDDDKTYGCIAHDSFCLEDFGLKDREKVKMILIKED